ncbi:MAG: hypothetical protein EBU88_09180 [Acidobacteria bacterium]|nr:hypothetical protein [Acidobacteriota bacterium]
MNSNRQYSAVLISVAAAVPLAITEILDAGTGCSQPASFPRPFHQSASTPNGRLVSTAWGTYKIRSTGQEKKYKPDQ